MFMSSFILNMAKMPKFGTLGWVSLKLEHFSSLQRHQIFTLSLGTNLTQTLCKIGLKGNPNTGASQRSNL